MIAATGALEARMSVRVFRADGTVEDVEVDDVVVEEGNDGSNLDE